MTDNEKKKIAMDAFEQGLQTMADYVAENHLRRDSERERDVQAKVNVFALDAYKGLIGPLKESK